MSDVVRELIAFLDRDPRIEGTVEPDTELVESGLVDSLVVIDLIVFLEERFGVALGPEDLTPRGLRSVAAIAELVERRS